MTPEQQEDAVGRERLQFARDWVRNMPALPPNVDRLVVKLRYDDGRFLILKVDVEKLRECSTTVRPSILPAVIRGLQFATLSAASGLALFGWVTNHTDLFVLSAFLLFAHILSRGKF